ncbi:hypothetical protein ACOME3_003266 [Neoechinorhynchus agilis]
MIRRDWCHLAKECGMAVLDEILSGKTQDDVVSAFCSILTQLADYMRSDLIPVEKYLIDKQLTKRLKSYTDPKSLPHVQVAIRLAKSGASMVKAGDVISYLICEDGTANPATQRAYSLKEFNDKSGENFKIDLIYYLANQIQPVVCRLIEPFGGGGIDTSIVAECLGIPQSMAIHNSVVNEAATNAVSDQDEEDDDLTLARFDDCDPFIVECPECGKCCKWTCPYRELPNGGYVSVLKKGCESCSWKPLDTLAYVKNVLIDRMRHTVNLFYLGWQRCEDAGCGHRTRYVPIRTLNCRPVCPGCQKSNLVPDYSIVECYTQFLYYHSIFDSDQFKRIRGSDLKGIVAAENVEGVKRSHDELTEFVKSKMMDRSAFGYVDLGDIFEGL